MKAKPSQWDGNRFLSSINNGRYYNEKLDAIEVRAFDIYKREFEDKKRFDFKAFTLLFKEKVVDFYEIAEEFIAGRQKANTRKFYRGSVKPLYKMYSKLEINQLSPSVLLEHEKEYYSSAYMRGLRAVV